MKTNRATAKRIKATRWGDRLAFLVLSAGAIAMLAPFWVMLSTSLIAPEQAYRYPPALWPSWPPVWQNYERLLTMVPMGTYLTNSVITALATALGQTLLCAMAGYAFSRLRFRFKNAVFLAFLATLMIPPAVNIAPLFFLMKTFGWIDTYWALIVPGLFGAFGVFLMRQWFNALPADLEDAARLDGCSPWGIFWRVAMPLARPALAALAVFAFIGSWNNLMWPLIATNSDAMRTLPVGVAALKSAFRDVTDWTLLMAAGVISIIPVALAFLAAQRQFLQGLLAGGVKE
ncbi:MAG: ABC transporter permease subunit [Vampirovibrionales bacterium]|nr:ABC transporter permease subunit [Vampirovibrionales bacterium]